MTRNDWERAFQLRAIDAFRQRLAASDALRSLLDALDGEESLRAKDLVARLNARSDDAVRTRVKTLNQQLQLFDKSLEARRQRYRLTISNHPYRLVLTPHSMALRRFWAAHTDQRRSSVQCTTPVFLRHPIERLIVRQLDLNDEDRWRRDAQMLLRKFRQRPGRGDAAAHAAFVELIRETLHSEFEARRPYVPVGEVRCASRMARCFGELGSEAYLELASEDTSADSTILLGNARTNPRIRALQERAGFCFRIEKSFVRIADGERFKDSLKPHGRLYAVVTRFADADNHTTTTIAANMSGAIHVLGEELTDNARLETILEEAGCNDWGELGTRFEMLFEIRLGAAQELIARSRLVDSRGL